MVDESWSLDDLVTSSRDAERVASADIENDVGKGEECNRRREMTR